CVSFQAGEFGPMNWVPQLNQVVPSPSRSGSQAIPLWTPGQTADLLMGLENMHLRSPLEQFDHANRPIPKPGAQAHPFRAPSQGSDQSRIGRLGESLSAVRHVPDLEFAGPDGGCRKLRAVRTPSQRGHRTALGLGDQKRFAANGVPDPDLAV